MELLKINRKSFVIDVDEIFKYCEEKIDVKNKQKEVIDSYELDENNDMRLSQKTVREIITPSEIEYNGEDKRFELIKSFLGIVLGTENVNDVESEKLPFSFKLSFNTLLNKGFIKETENG